MCGRYASAASRADLQALYDVTESGPELEWSWNVAPTDQVYGVVERHEKDSGTVDRQLRALRWGLVPSWAKDPKIGSRLINARVETLASKPAWRSAFAKRRAIIPASGYYEWQPVDVDGKVHKQPYYIHPAGDGILSFAGLYEFWPDPAKEPGDPDRWLWSTTIITTDATGPAGEIHDRTPLILPPDRIDAWLDPALTDPDQVARLLAGVAVEPLAVRPVSRAVNNVRTDGPELVEPLEAATDQPLQLALV